MKVNTDIETIKELERTLSFFLEEIIDIYNSSLTITIENIEIIEKFKIDLRTFIDGEMNDWLCKCITGLNNCESAIIKYQAVTFHETSNIETGCLSECREEIPYDIDVVSSMSNITDNGDCIKFTIQTSNDVIDDMPKECFGNYQTNNGGLINLLNNGESLELSIDKKTHELLKLANKIPLFVKVTTKINSESFSSYKLIFQQHDGIDTLENADFMSDNVNTSEAKKAHSQAPYGSDSKPLNIHHLTREDKNFTIYVELEESYHQKKSKELHFAISDKESYRNDIFLEKQFNNFKSGYYKYRLADILEKITGSYYKKSLKYTEVNDTVKSLQHTHRTQKNA